jgi:putative Mg2+ transporter-C (MgtC) family protein
MSVILERLLLSLFAGFLIGLERQIHRQPAGLKTHILICSGSTLLTIVSLVLAGGLGIIDHKSPIIGDPARLAAQIVSGIGFLGGGAIIRQGFNIKGLTTAATIWVSAAIGIALGVGSYSAAGIALLSVLGTLIVLERIEYFFFPAKNVKTLYVVYDDKNFDYHDLEKSLALHKIIVNNIDFARTMASTKQKLTLQVHIPPQVDYDELVSTLEKVSKLVRVELTSHEMPSR